MYCDEKYVQARIAVEEKGYNWEIFLALSKAFNLWMQRSSIEEKKRVMSLKIKDECAKGPKT